ncbi:hypothetical protein L6R53_31730 [Myxococcota bacterium]|nr:hypothetical protein [Myxococcota bacterium]
MDRARLRVGLLALALLLPGVARAGVTDQVQAARAALVADDLKAATQALDAAQEAAPTEGAVVPARLLAQVFYYRGVLELKGGDKKGKALDALRQALLIDNAFEWDSEVLDQDDPRSLFEALRAEVRSRPRVDAMVPEQVGAARLYVDGSRRSAGDEVLEGMHLAQIECPDGAVYGKWTDFAKDPRWLKLCPGGVDTSVVVADTGPAEDEWADFGPVFGDSEGTGGEAASTTGAVPTASPAEALAAAARAKAEEEARKKAQADAAAAAAKAKAEADAAAKAKAEADAAAKAKAEEDARKKAEADAAAAAAAAAAKAEADAAAKAKAEEDARKKAEADAAAKAKAEEEARKKAEADARRKEEAEAKARAEAAAATGPRVLPRPAEEPKDEPVADNQPKDPPPPTRVEIGGESGLSSGKSRSVSPLGSALLGGGGVALASATTYYFVAFAPNYADLQDARDDAASVDRETADTLESRHDTRRVLVLGLGGVGLAAAAAGGVVIALDDDLPVRPFIGWGLAGVRGRF